MYPGVRERTAIAGADTCRCQEMVLCKKVCKASLAVFGGGLGWCGWCTKCSHWASQNIMRLLHSIWTAAVWHYLNLWTTWGYQVAHWHAVWKSQNKNWSFQRKRYFAVFYRVILFQKACNIMKDAPRKGTWPSHTLWLTLTVRLPHRIRGLTVHSAP